MNKTPLELSDKSLLDQVSKSHPVWKYLYPTLEFDREIIMLFFKTNPISFNNTKITFDREVIIDYKNSKKNGLKKLKKSRKSIEDIVPLKVKTKKPVEYKMLHNKIHHVQVMNLQ